LTNRHAFFAIVGAAQAFLRPRRCQVHEQPSQDPRVIPAWIRDLAKALVFNGLRPGGRRITGVGERHNLSNWWFNYPSRARLRWSSGIRAHGVRGHVRLSVKSWAFYRASRRQR